MEGCWKCWFRLWFPVQTFTELSWAYVNWQRARSWCSRTRRSINYIKYSRRVCHLQPAKVIVTRKSLSLKHVWLFGTPEPCKILFKHVVHNYEKWEKSNGRCGRPLISDVNLTCPAVRARGSILMSRVFLRPTRAQTLPHSKHAKKIQ